MRSLVFFLCALLAGTAHAANVRVQAGGAAGIAFVPQTVTIRPGDTVTFVNLGGLHNVVADNGAFRCARGCDGDGHGGNGGASTQIWMSVVTFNNVGRFGYFCEPHGAPGQGMFGTVIVQQAPPPDPVPAAGWLGVGLLAIALAVAGVSRIRRNA